MRKLLFVFGSFIKIEIQNHPDQTTLRKSRVRLNTLSKNILSPLIDATLQKTAFDGMIKSDEGIGEN